MLDTTVLRDALVKLSIPPVAMSPAEAANRLAAAYEEYAKGAVAVTVPMTPSGAEVRGLAACLRPALDPLLSNPLTLANAISLGVLTYWFFGTNTAFVGGTVVLPTGAIILPPQSASALTTALVPILTAPTQPTETWASAAASALHTCTLTVQVVLAGGQVVPVL